MRRLNVQVRLEALEQAVSVIRGRRRHQPTSAELRRELSDILGFDVSKLDDDGWAELLTLLEREIERRVDGETSQPSGNAG